MSLVSVFSSISARKNISGSPKMSTYSFKVETDKLSPGGIIVAAAVGKTTRSFPSPSTQNTTGFFIRLVFNGTCIRAK